MHRSPKRGSGGLRGEAEASLPVNLLRSFDQCHAARRSDDTVASEVRIALSQQCDELVSAACDAAAMDAAWEAIAATRLGRAAQQLIGDKALYRAKAQVKKLR